jgi:hypothetical protein
VYAKHQSLSFLRSVASLNAKLETAGKGITQEKVLLCHV